MKLKILAVLVVLLMMFNVVEAATYTFANHTPVNDEFTEYWISGGERYSDWATYLEKKYNLFFKEAENVRDIGATYRVGPTYNARRWEIMSLLYLLNEDKFIGQDSFLNYDKEVMNTASGPFPLDDEVYKRIFKMLDKKYINGYENGTYGAFKTVTRAEFVKMLDSFGYLPEAAFFENVFIDTKGHWAETYIKKAANAGVIYGVSDQYFSPDETITVEQVLAIFDRILPDDVEQLQEVFIETYNAKFVAPGGKKVVLSKCRLLNEEEKEFLNNYEDKYRPKQVDYYPFISNEVPSEAYDFPFIQLALPDMASPSSVYQSPNIEYYKVGASRAEKVLNKILNVDYETIDYKNLSNTLIANCLGGLRYSYGGEDVIRNYVEYVKENKIKIEGSAKAMYPIMYLDGILIRIRMKIDFKITSSDTNVNLLLKPDVNGIGTTVFDKKIYSFYTDVAIAQPFDSVSRYYYPEDIMQLEHFGE